MGMFIDNVNNVNVFRQEVGEDFNVMKKFHGVMCLHQGVSSRRRVRTYSASRVFTKDERDRRRFSTPTIQQLGAECSTFLELWCSTVREFFLFGRGTAFLLEGECEVWTYQIGRCDPSCSQAGNETLAQMVDPIYTGWTRWSG